jgi:ribosomal protein S27E
MSYASTNNEYHNPDYDYTHEDRPGYEQRVHYKLSIKALSLGVYPINVRCHECGHDTVVNEEHSEYIHCEECGEEISDVACLEIQNAIDSFDAE